MTKKRYALFASLTIVLAMLLTTSAIIAGDVYLHRKYADLVGLNVWGYRGPAVGRKQPNEWRLAVLGESTAFGYGVRWTEAFPSYLQAMLNESSSPSRRHVAVVNLAYNNEGSHSYQFTLRDYAYLDYDAVLFYSGYNDNGGANTEVFRHNSAIFRLTGYLPIFPIVFREKAMAIRYGGRLEDAYLGKKTTFRPDITERATATTLETAAAIAQSLDNQFGRQAIPSNAARATVEGKACGRRWAYYCGEMHTAIRLALDQGKKVLMVTQPYRDPGQIDQQQHLQVFLRDRFGDNPRMHFADLGHAVDLKDATLSYDSLHLTAEGNRRIAAALVPHVRGFMP